MNRIESSSPRLNRRTLLAGGTALGLSHLLRQSADAAPVQSEPSPALYFQSAPSEANRKEMIDLTTEHLFDLYSGLMTEENGYVGSINNDIYKRECFLRIAWMADKLNPQNENLGNQIAAVLLYQSEFSTEFEREYQNGTVARGMMRFTPNTLARISKHLGETITLDEVGRMSPLHQLKLVEANLQICKEQYGTDFDNIYDVYMAALSPSHIGKNPDETLLELNQDDPNSDYDTDNNRAISIREATQPVIDKALRFGEKKENLLEEMNPESPPASLDEALQLANADFEKMSELADANTALYGNSPPQYLCLQGVQDSLEAVDLSVKRQPSAYLLADILRNDERFAEISVFEDDYESLPRGCILVYPRNKENEYDYAKGAHHGHTGIVIGRNENNQTIVGSDHHTLLSNDLENMEHNPSIFVPTHKPPEVNASEEISFPHHAAIKAGYGDLPSEYFSSSADYEEAVKNEFGIYIKGFDREHSEWIWEILWATKNTRFSESAKNCIYVVEHNNDLSSQKQCLPNGLPDVYLVPFEDKSLFQRIFLHEGGHFDHCVDHLETGGEKLDRMQEIIDQEGHISAYGESDGPTENYADMIMYTLDPSDGYVSIGEGTPDNPIYNGSRPLHTAFAKEVLGIPN